MNRGRTTRGMIITRPDPSRPYISKVHFGASRNDSLTPVVPSGPSDKILIVLQYWSGDKAQAMELAKLIADIEPGISQQADFLFVCRFDCRHDMDVVRYVSRKFSTFHHVSPRRGTGWPAGCNDLFFGGLEWIYHKMRARKLPHYKAVFFIEADCSPLSVDWISLMSSNWDKIQPVFVAGRKLRSEHIHEHINGGSCALSGDFRFLEWLVMGPARSNDGAGWDYRLADDFRRWGWAELPGVECFWNRPTLSDGQIQNLKDSGVIWLHGVKSNAVLDFSRKTLL